MLCSAVAGRAGFLALVFVFKNQLQSLAGAGQGQARVGTGDEAESFPVLHFHAEGDFDARSVALTVELGIGKKIIDVFSRIDDVRRPAPVPGVPITAGGQRGEKSGLLDGRLGRRIRPLPGSRCGKSANDHHAQSCKPD